MAEETTRDELFSAAYRLFDERGFERVSVHEVAKHADKSVGSVYLYFANKEALCEAAVAVWLHSMAALLRGADGPEGMWKVWRSMTERNPEFARWLVRPLGEEARKALLEVDDVVRVAVASVTHKFYPPTAVIRWWIGLLGEPDPDALFKQARL